MKVANFSPLLGTHGHVLTNEGSLAYQSCSVTGHPFMWSSPRTRDTHLVEHFMYNKWNVSFTSQQRYIARYHLYIWYHTVWTKNRLSPCAWIYGERAPLMAIVKSGSDKMSLRAVSQEQASLGTVIVLTPAIVYFYLFIIPIHINLREHQTGNSQTFATVNWFPDISLFVMQFKCIRNVSDLFA